MMHGTKASIICPLMHTVRVAFGANRTYNYASATSNEACNNGVFGEPTPRTFKACVYSLTADAPAGLSGYIFCGSDSLPAQNLIENDSD